MFSTPLSFSLSIIASRLDLYSATGTFKYPLQVAHRATLSPCP